MVLKQQRSNRKPFITPVLLVITLLLVVFSISNFFLRSPETAHAATSSNLNFQARLLNASGNIVADGYYNIEFKLYDVSSGGVALWTETHYDSNGGTAGNDNRLRVKNGYFSVNLGSLTAFPGTIKWDQEHWITMNIGGSDQTATPTWDGEMTPRIKLTAVPYAFRAQKLAFQSGSFTHLLELATPTASRTVTVPNSSAATDTVCLLTLGNCFGSGSGGTLQAAYSADGDGSDTIIALDANDDSLIFRNPLLAGTDSTFLLTLEQLNTGAKDGLIVTQAGTGFALRINDDGTATDSTPLVVDATGRLGVGLTNPGFTVDAVGSINASVDLRVAGTVVCDNTGCDAKANSGNYIRNSTAQQTSANFNIKSGNANQVTSVVEGFTSATVPVAVIRNGATPGVGGDLLQLQNSSSVALLTITSAADLIFEGTDDAFETTITVANAAADRTYTIPDSTGNATDTFCLLTLANCAGTSSTLQGSYNADVDGSDAIIALTATDGSLIFRNPAASGSTSAYVLTVDQLATGAVGGLFVSNAGTGASFRVDDQASDTTPFIVDQSGNVGIGTAGPTSNLHLSNAEADTEISLQNTSAAGRHFILGSGGTGSSVPGTFSLYDATAGSFRLLVNSAGNVGIGTTSPTAFLHAKGNLSSALTGTVAVTNLSTTVTGTGTAFTTELTVGDSIKIGTEIFTVSAIGSATSLTLDSAYQGATASGLTAYRDPTLFAIDNGDSVNKLTVTRSGNVGIGIAAPTSRLHVPWLSGDTTYTATFGSTNTANNQVAIQAHSYSQSAFYGTSNSASAIYGVSTNSNAFYGEAQGAGSGVFGHNTSTGTGVFGTATSGSGVFGQSSTGISGFFKTSNTAGTNTVATLVTELNTSQTADLFQARTSSGGFLFGINNTAQLVWEGATADDFEVTVTVADPTADRTYTIPNSTAATDTFCLVTLANCGGSSTTTLGQAYTNDVDGSDAIIALTSTDGAVVIRDAATTIGDLFKIQNNGGTANYLQVSASAVTLQDSAGNNALVFDSTTSELRVYDNVASPTAYARLYYASGEAVFAASTGTTKIGNGSGDILLVTTAVADDLSFSHSGTAAAAYTGTDATITRNLTGGANALGGSVFKITDTSTANAGIAINPTLLLINQAATTGTISGNLIDAQLAGASRFSVTTAGVVSATGAVQGAQSGTGTAFRIGDDMTIVDHNVSNSFRFQGVQNSANAEFYLGSGSNFKLSNWADSYINAATGFKLGIGILSPSNTLSVSPLQYNTGTAGTGGVASTTVTGVGTTWTSAMIGSEIVFANGQKGTITAVASATSLTVAASVTVPAGTSYSIHYTGLQVTSTGNVGIGDTSPDFKLTVLPTADNATHFGVQQADGQSAFTAGTFGSGVGFARVHDSVGTTAIELVGSGTNYINSGNLGIGDASPAYLLTVGNGDLFGVNSSGQLLFEGATVDANKFTVTVADPTANRTYTIPNSTAATDTFCLVTLANCSGSSGTLQQAYTADVDGSDAVIALTSTDGAVIIRDNATPLGTTLFAVQNSAGTTSYLNVSATGATIAGTLQVTSSTETVAIIDRNTNTANNAARMTFRMRDSVNADTDYAAIQSYIFQNNNTAEQGGLNFLTLNALSGGFRTVATLTHEGKLGVGTTGPSGDIHVLGNNGLTVEDADSSAVLKLYNATNSPVADTQVGVIEFNGEDSNNVAETYASIQGFVSSNAATLESGYLTFSTKNAGTLAPKMRLTNDGYLIFPGSSGATACTNVQTIVCIDNTGIDFRNSGGNLSSKFSQASNDQLVLSSGAVSNFLGLRIQGVSGSAPNLALRVNTGQTSDLLQLQNSSGSKLFTVSATGELLVENGGLNALGDQESMVPNAGFEVNNDATTSVGDGWTSEGTGSFAVTTTSPAQGTNSQQITATSAQTAGVYSACIPVMGDRGYNLSTRLKASSATTSGLYVRLEGYTSKANCASRTSVTNYDAVNNGATTTSYADLGGTVTTGSTIIWARVSIAIINPNVTSTFTYDNVKLTSALSVGVGTAQFSGNLIQLGNGVNALGDQESMVPNAGFEVNEDGVTTVADGWAFTQTSGTPTAAVTTTSPAQGDRSQTITTTATTQVGTLTSACVPVSGGNPYSLYARVKSGVGSTSGPVLDMDLITYTSKANCVSQVSGTTVTVVADAGINENYTTHGGTGTPGATATWARVVIASDTPDLGTFTMTVDSVRLTPSSLLIGIDLAENFPVEAGENLSPGEIVSFGATAPEGGSFVVRSNGVYNGKAFGVVSTQPGLTLDDGHSYDKVTVALAGRVPVKVSAENGPIEVGDPITTSSIPGVGMKATAAGRIIGTAVTAFNGEGEGTIIVLINPEFWAPPMSETLQAGSALFGSLQVTGTASIANLNVSGQTTLTTLTVTDNAEVQGTLTVTQLVVKQNITLEGHIYSAGIKPAIEKNINLGTDTQVLAASVEIDGTDTAGTITLIAGKDAQKGVLAKIMFNKAYEKAPRIVVSAVNEDGLSLPVFVRKIEGGFEIVTSVIPQTGKTYQFDYIILGSTGVDP